MILKHTYRGLVIALGSLGLALATWAGPGFLASKGPVPLRFLPVPQEPKVVPQVATTSAPPATTPTVTPSVPGDLSYILAAPEPFPGPMVQPTPTVQAVSAPGSGTNLVTGAVQSDEVVSTQMLLKYFDKSGKGKGKGNGGGTGVIVPLNFAPAHAPEPVSSTATYTNAP